jgi:hypothetical protein
MFPATCFNPVAPQDGGPRLFQHGTVVFQGIVLRKLSVFRCNLIELLGVLVSQVWNQIRYPGNGPRGVIAQIICKRPCQVRRVQFTNSKVNHGIPRARAWVSRRIWVTETCVQSRDSICHLFSPDARNPTAKGGLQDSPVLFPSSLHLHSCMN